MYGVRRAIQALEASIEEAEATKQRLKQQAATTSRPISQLQISRTIASLANLLRTGDIQLRKSYLRLFIDSVVVHDGEIVISGTRRALAKAAEAGPGKPSNPVPVFVQEWRP